jgi:hypothetical protein
MQSLDTIKSSAILPHDIGLPDQPPRRDAGHDQLAACLGTWKVEGMLASSGTRMMCTESYEWLPGKFFIIYRFDRQIGAQDQHGFGVIGFDVDRRAHFAYFVDNMGYARTYDVHIDGSKWAFIGNWERATLTFNPQRHRMSARWEHSTDGHVWRELCAFEGRRE